ncbi:helix-turn-helix domain-containing protein [Bergeriella denitrificans]|uniref:Winged helix-turn-helix domain-containing protein n=1 Tax=Bergeriella denitrificans TaxID=494 RepID=A0A378UHQ0_BERDE|nr:helix-turn-helix domain-containing protein [Bergeriella denitrificans]STZ76856.1 Uncharacterised protein [Bergeriella denitrificans]
MQKETAQTQTHSDGQAGSNDIIMKPARPKFKPESQCGEILAYIRAHGSITHHQAAQMGIMGFNARINEIRAAGYPVICTMTEHINKHGKAVKRGVFTLAVETEGAAA